MSVNQSAIKSPFPAAQPIPVSSQVSSMNLPQLGGAVPASGGSGGDGQAQVMRNMAWMCRAGCETVQEIVIRTAEVFSLLRTMPLPNGTGQGAQMSLEKKQRIYEYLGTIQRQFKGLRTIYIRVNDDCATVEYTPQIESLIPYKDDVDSRQEQRKIGENYRHLVDEARDLREQLFLKSRYMKEVVDQLRKIIWELNTMLAMSNT